MGHVLTLLVAGGEEAVSLLIVRPVHLQFLRLVVAGQHPGLHHGLPYLIMGATGCGPQGVGGDLKIILCTTSGMYSQINENKYNAKS